MEAIEQVIDWYIALPIKAQALQWDGSLESIQKICKWVNENADEPWVDYVYLDNRVFDVFLHLTSGHIEVNINDWIIMDVEGGIELCEDELFRKCYERCET